MPRDELAEVIWGEQLPATWEKALRVLMTKLRRLLEECGIDRSTGLTSAFGCYTLALPPDTWIDVRAAARALGQAETALTAGDLEEARAQAETAATLSRPTFLPGEDGSWVVEQRRGLRDVLLRALECLRDASLAAGESGEAVRSAVEITELEPFRESGYRRLMEAHVAAGDRAEALQVYERCRRLLAEELGAYPSPETDSVYRSLLDAPSGRAAANTPDATSLTGTAPPPPGRRTRPALWVAGLVSLVVLVAAGTAIVVVATRGDGSSTSSGAAPPQVALVVPSTPAWSPDPSQAYEDAVNLARSQDGISTQTFHLQLKKPGLSALSKRARESIGNSGLVLLAGQSVGARFVREFARHPQTRFVVIDPDPERHRLYTAVTRNRRNTSDVFFAEGSGAYLAGFLAAKMALKMSGKQDAISLVGSYPSFDENVVPGFQGGAWAAVPGITIHIAYSRDVTDPSKCAALATRQIERGGSRVVYADAGGCSSGALSAVEAHRGVWAIAGDQAPSSPFGRLLGYTVKDFGQEVTYAIQRYLNHTLPHGHVDIGIERQAVDFRPNTRLIPAKTLESLRSARERLMPFWKGWAAPLK